jgi:hypothetical protein
MRKQFFVALTLASLFLSSPVLAAVTGVWSADANDDDKNRILLQIRHRQSSIGQTVGLAELQGLDRAALHSASDQPVAFTIRRDAGTFTFQGTFHEGVGAGHFRFEPASDFYEQLRVLGVRELDGEKDELIHLAMLDVSREFIRDLKSLGYENLTLDEVTSMRIHGASPEYIRELRKLGYSDLPVESLVNLRIHGATPEFIRAMASEGFRPDADGLTNMRIHGVTAPFVSEMRALGYKLDADDLTTFRIHGVTTKFVRELKDLGYERVDAEDLVSMRIHGVTTELIRSLRDAGFDHVPVEKLIDMRIHGIDDLFIRSVKKNKSNG